MSESQSVLVTPDVGIGRVLRGYTNFEDIYQGKLATNPLYLSDRPSGKDPVAEQAFARLNGEFQRNHHTIPLSDNDTGIDPWLVRGVPVPFGAQVILYLPIISNGLGLNGNYQIEWRIRSASNFAQNQEPFHAAFDGNGQTDDGSVQASEMGFGLVPLYAAGAPRQRRVIISSYEPVVFAKPEPLTGRAIQDMLPLQARTVAQAGAAVPAPLFPPFTGAGGVGAVTGSVQQGVLNNGLSPLPIWYVYTTRAKGDELILTVQSDASDSFATWNFDSLYGVQFSFFFGRCGFKNPVLTSIKPLVPIPQLGVYLFTGSAP